MSILSDKIVRRYNDDLFIGNETADIKSPDHSSGMWARTEVEYGYGYHHRRLGKSFLDETIDIGHNTVPISGVQTALQILFNTRGPISIPTLYDDMGIGIPNESHPPTFLTPSTPVIGGSATSQQGLYAVGHFVQLFGVGVTGTAENNITVHKVGYRETSIEGDIMTPDGVINGAMYPFRYTDSELDPQERQKYFGKKIDTDTGKIGFYLKRFEGEPEIKHIWKTEETMDSDVEVAVTTDTVFDFTRDDIINTFIEIHLQITRKDLKEFFNFKLDQPESCRINTIALYDGMYSETGKPDGEQFGDFCNVRLFSKLNIPTEPLSLSKDLEIIYRIYGS